jgi:pimeloyl-ACP methyl ester carboxylesterase
MPEFDPIVGRYVYVEVEGVRNCVYFEEVGTGVPLLCLHTAGADSRQYKHLLCDADITSRWRVISFDLPYHGRSMPPDGWWEKEYLLTTEAYAGMVMAFVRALGLQRPVMLGCSMGGAIVLELARKHAGEVGAVIGLEAASKVEGRFSDWTVMPDVDGSVVAAWWIYGLMTPQSPEVCRREVWWHYGQGEARCPEHFHGGDPHDGPMPMDYFVWAAVSAEHTVVVDAGFSAEVAEERQRTHLRCPTDGLAALGIDCARLPLVVLTHLHYDHVGNLEKFPPPTSWSRTTRWPSGRGATRRKGTSATSSRWKTSSTSCGRTSPDVSASSPGRARSCPG